MSDFSEPWDDGDGVKGLWILRPGLPSIRNEQVFQQIKERRTEHLRLCRKWRAAAEADGWKFGPTYGDHESVETAFRGHREGFTIQGLARPGKDGGSPCASISIWGPDGLKVKTPLTYDMDAIRRGIRSCGYCDREDVETVRVGFAGRCCLICEPTVRPQIETRGWNA